MAKWKLSTPGYPTTEFEGTPEDAFDVMLNEIISYVDGSYTSVIQKVPTLHLLRELKENGAATFMFSNGDVVQVWRTERGK